jgi:hypothetical protein
MAAIGRKADAWESKLGAAMTRNFGVLTVLILLGACASGPSRPDPAAVARGTANAEDATTEELSPGAISAARRATEQARRCEEPHRGIRAVRSSVCEQSLIDPVLDSVTRGVTNDVGN